MFHVEHSGARRSVRGSSPLRAGCDRNYGTGAYRDVAAETCSQGLRHAPPRPPRRRRFGLSVFLKKVSSLQEYFEQEAGCQPLVAHVEPEWPLRSTGVPWYFHLQS